MKSAQKWSTEKIHRCILAIIHNHENLIAKGFIKLFSSLFQTFQVHYGEYLDLPVTNVKFFQSFGQVIEEIVLGMNIENGLLQINERGV